MQDANNVVWELSRCFPCHHDNKKSVDKSWLLGPTANMGGFSRLQSRFLQLRSGLCEQRFCAIDDLASWSNSVENDRVLFAIFYDDFLGNMEMRRTW
jgi:hypothetical protein